HLGMLLHLDYDLNSNAFPHPLDGSNIIVATDFMLAFDTCLYLALAIYFEKILPNEYGHRRPPLFFLKSSFWSQTQKADHVALEDEMDADPSSHDSFEPVPPEFHGKEAIRILSVVLIVFLPFSPPLFSSLYLIFLSFLFFFLDLVFDIYEGQITLESQHC
uniref:ATP binding cassette subfamily A member 8 n=1 Tax=Rhinopithecus bieti TaxID=61621 RepID=A0A2K6JMQ2_RHIBE